MAPPKSRFVAFLVGWAILRAIARERDTGFGVYGSTVRPGRVTVGDDVEIES